MKKEKVRISAAALVILLFSSWTIGIAQETRVQSSKERLQRLRREIFELRQKLAQQKVKENDYLSQLEQIDRQTTLIRKLVVELKTQEAETRKELYASNQRLLRLQEEFSRQKEIYKDRLIHFYKHGRTNDLEILMTASNLNQVWVWLKYSRKIAAADQRRLENLLSLKEKISQESARKRAQLQRLDQLLAEKKKEESTLIRQRKEKEALLDKIRQDKRLFAQKIAEYERSAREIERFIREAETNRVLAPLNLARPSLFPSLKGKMIWPTRGTILHEFGKVKNPNLNTYYMNIGVDIKAPFGQEVQAVCPGVITKITWQRSRGNIVIINHFEGYYTVYAHLSEITVVLGEEVKAGSIIGRVGETGSISGPMLHFEVWHKTTPENPLLWLSKKPTS